MQDSPRITRGVDVKRLYLLIYLTAPRPLLLSPFQLLDFLRNVCYSEANISILQCFHIV